MDSYNNRELRQRTRYFGVLAVVCIFTLLSSACESDDDERVFNADNADSENDSAGPSTTVGPDGLVAGWADCIGGEYAGAFFNGQGGYDATIAQTNAGCEMLVRWSLEMSGYETRKCVKPPSDGSAAPEYNVGSGLDLDLDAVCKVIRVEQSAYFIEDEGLCGDIVDEYDGKSFTVDLVAAKTNSAVVNNGINAIGCCAESRVGFRLGSDSGVGYDVISEREGGENEGCSQTIEYFNGGETPQRVVECEFAYLSYASARPGTVRFAENFETLPRYEELSECELVEE